MVYSKLLFLGILSIPIIYFSRLNLLKPRSHGFYRFLSWECIAWLLVNNFKLWIKNPISFYQIISWIFLIGSLVLVISGVILMKKSGMPDKNREDTALHSFEKTTQLISIGIFKYIRHPLYGSLLLLTWGIFFKNITLQLLSVAILSSIFLIITAKIEEKENLEYFGENYLQYKKTSKMFIPFLW